MTAYRTMDTGQLLDLEYDSLQETIEVRCGTSLTPSERPIVLTLTPADAVWLMQHLQAIYHAHPVDISLQQCIEDVKRGATHDCGEWLLRENGGVSRCRLCRREYDTQDRSE